MTENKASKSSPNTPEETVANDVENLSGNENETSTRTTPKNDEQFETLERHWWWNNRLVRSETADANDEEIHEVADDVDCLRTYDVIDLRRGMAKCAGMRSSSSSSSSDAELKQCIGRASAQSTDGFYPSDYDQDCEDCGGGGDAECEAEQDRFTPSDRLTSSEQYIYDDEADFDRINSTQSSVSRNADSSSTSRGTICSQCRDANNGIVFLSDDEDATDSRFENIIKNPMPVTCHQKSGDHVDILQVRTPVDDDDDVDDLYSSGDFTSRSRREAENDAVENEVCGRFSAAQSPDIEQNYAEPTPFADGYNNNRSYSDYDNVVYVTANNSTDCCDEYSGNMELLLLIDQLTMAAEGAAGDSYIRVIGGNPSAVCYMPTYYVNDQCGVEITELPSDYEDEDKNDTVSAGQLQSMGDGQPTAGQHMQVDEISPNDPAEIPDTLPIGQRQHETINPNDSANEAENHQIGRWQDDGRSQNDQEGELAENQQTGHWHWKEIYAHAEDDISDKHQIGESQDELSPNDQGDIADKPIGADETPDSTSDAVKRTSPAESYSTDGMHSKTEDYENNNWQTDELENLTFWAPTTVYVEDEAAAEIPAASLSNQNENEMQSRERRRHSAVEQNDRKTNAVQIISDSDKCKRGLGRTTETATNRPLRHAVETATKNSSKALSQKRPLPYRPTPRAGNATMSSRDYNGFLPPVNGTNRNTATYADSRRCPGGRGGGPTRSRSLSRHDPVARQPPADDHHESTTTGQHHHQQPRIGQILAPPVSIGPRAPPRLLPSIVPSHRLPTRPRRSHPLAVRRPHTPPNRDVLSSRALWPSLATGLAVDDGARKPALRRLPPLAERYTAGTTMWN